MMPMRVASHGRPAARKGHAGKSLRAFAASGLAILAFTFGARAETLTLAECLHETLEHDPVIVQKRLGLEEAGGQRLVFHARALPTLLVQGLVGEQGRQTSANLQVSVLVNGKAKTVTEVQPRPATSYLIGTEALYQPIFDASIPASWRRGNIALAVARSNFLVTATAELHAARLEFYSVLFQQQSGALLREISQRLDANAKGVGELVAAGLSGRGPLLQAQIQQVNFQPQILASVGSLHTNLTTLLQTMGRPLGAGANSEGSITLVGPWEDGPLVFEPGAATRESRARRPDLQALRDLVRSSTEDANVVRGGYYPAVKIYVTGQLLPQDFVQSQRTNSVRPEDNTDVTQISPGVQEVWNIIDTGAVRGGVRQLESLRDAISIQVQQLERNIPSELASVRARFDDAAKKRDLFTSNVAISGDTLKLIESGVTQGTNSQLEFLDAESGVLSTRLGLLDAQLEMSLAHADYDRVIGGYLRFIEQDKPAKADSPK